MTNSNIPEGITEEMIQAAISNPGMVVSRESPSSSAPKQHVPISGYGTNIRPNIPGNTGFVDGPSKSLATNLAKQAQDFAAAESKRLAKADEDKKALSNQALRRDLEILKRQVKKLQSQLKEHNHSDD